MSFCDHCDRQRFDRARISSTAAPDPATATTIGWRSECREDGRADRSSGIPHLEREDDVVDGQVVH